MTSIQAHAFLQGMMGGVLPIIMIVGFLFRERRMFKERKAQLKEAYQNGYLRGTADERQNWVYKK